MELLRSPLHDEHIKLDAKLVEFGGWEMPLSYPAGTIAEHRACRESAAIFDVSHLGTVRVSGPGAFESLQHAMTNDLKRIEPGRAQYTHLLAADGSVMDDIIIWWVEPERFDVMPNASNTERVRGALSEFGTDRLGLEDVTHERAVIAVQGPEARSRLSEISTEAAEVRRFRVAPVRWRDTTMIVAGTGYTGEDGVECAVPNAHAAELWAELVEVGMQPAGLGARDTLRLEAGLPLHGHELGEGITPLQAGLGWVVRWDKGDFRGRNALEIEREEGPPRLLRGLEVRGRRPPRAGQTVEAGGREIGQVTSGNFSPMLGCGIALALLEPSVEVGDRVTIKASGRSTEADVVEVPFLRD